MCNGRDCFRAYTAEVEEYYWPDAGDLWSEVPYRLRVRYVPVRWQSISAFVQKAPGLLYTDAGCLHGDISLAACSMEERTYFAVCG